MESLSITINGIKVEAKQGDTILEASFNVGIYIPSLCAHPDLPTLVGMKPLECIYQINNQFKNDNTIESSDGHKGCQLCVVKLNGSEGLNTSCSTTVEQGMSIQTETLEIKEY
ncbi:hypothetical protein LCGC14_1825840, partial [marine sediment metagenome]